MCVAFLCKLLAQHVYFYHPCCLKVFALLPHALVPLLTVLNKTSCAEKGTAKVCSWTPHPPRYASRSTHVKRSRAQRQAISFAVSPPVVQGTCGSGLNLQLQLQLQLQLPLLPPSVSSPLPSLKRIPLQQSSASLQARRSKEEERRKKA